MPDTYEISDPVSGSTYHVDMDHEPTDDDVRSILTEARKTWGSTPAPVLRPSSPPRLESKTPPWISDFREDPEAPSVPIPGAGRQLAALSKPSALSQYFGIDAEAPPAARAMAKETGTILTRPLQKALGGVRDVGELALSTVTPGAGGRLAQNADKATDALVSMVPLKDEIAATLDGGIGAGLDAYTRNFAEDPIGQVLNTAGAVGLMHSPVAREANSASRSIMASGDLSAPLRQGAVLSVTRPKQAIAAGEAMFKAGKSVSGAQRVAAEIASRPTAPLHERFGLAVGAGNEFYGSSYAKELPVVGAVVKASDRAFDGYLQRLRADVFDSTAEGLQKRGITPESDPKTYQDLADWVNVASGVGKLGPFEQVPRGRGDVAVSRLSVTADKAGSVEARPGVFRATPQALGDAVSARTTAATIEAQSPATPGALSKLTPALREVLFAPSWTASRVQLLSPSTYLNLSPEVRKIALRDMMGATSTALGAMALAKASGAEVETDPQSADWGKIRVGDTRYDTLAGLRPWARLVALGAQTWQTGDARPLNQAVGKRAEGMLAPMPSMVLDAVRGSTYSGKPFAADEAMTSRFTSLFLQDLADAVRDQGAVGAVQAAPAGLGVGYQRYQTRGRRGEGGRLLERR